MRYDAFLSYSHALDGYLAPALQRGLQRFAKRWNQARALRVFRDDADLATSPQLWRSIEQALSESRFFILLASPRAASSAWVAREVEWWLANRSPETMLIVLTEGMFDWRKDGLFTDAVPQALAARLTDEPRYLDLRWARSRETDLSLQHNKFREALADLAATLHGKSKDELIGEEVRQQRRARQVRRVVVTALALLTIAATTTAIWAVRQQREAERQTQVAEANFGIALDAADAIVSEVATTLTNLEGVSKNRIAKILANAERLFDRLTTVGEERRHFLDRQAALMIAFASAYMELGDIHASLSRAESAIAKLEIARHLPPPPTDEELDARLAAALFLKGQAQQDLEDTEAALASFDEAMKLFSVLVESQPDNGGWLADYAEAHYYVYLIHFNRGEIDQALAVGEAGMSFLRRAVALEPDNQRWVRDLAFGNHAIASALEWQGRRTEAIGALNEARASLETLLSSDPQNADVKFVLSIVYRHLARLLGHAGGIAQSIELMQRSVSLLEQLVRFDPSNAINLADYVATLEDLSRQHLALGEASEAASIHQNATNTLQSALNDEPESVPLKRALAEVESRGASVDPDLAPAEALLVYERSLETLLAVEEEDSANRGLQEQIAELLIRIADEAAAEGLTEKAELWIAQAFKRIESLIATDPLNSNYQLLHSNALASDGWTRQQSGDLAGAEASFLEGLEIAGRSVRRFPENMGWVNSYINHCNRLITLYTDLEDTKKALATASRAKDLLSEIGVESEEAIEELVQLWLQVGWLSRRQGNEADSLRAFETGVSLLDRLASDEGRSANTWRLAAEGHGAIALLYDFRQQDELASESYKHANEALSKRLEIVPDDLGSLKTLAANLALLGWVYIRLEQWREAEIALLDAVHYQSTIVKRFPDDVDALNWLAGNHGQLAIVYDVTGRYADGAKASLAATDLYARLLTLKGGDVEVLRLLAAQQVKTAALNLQQGSCKDAITHLLHARETWLRILQTNPADDRTQFEFARSEKSAFQCYLHIGNLEAAEASLVTANDLLQKLSGHDSALPYIPDLRVDLMVSAAQLLLAQGQAAASVVSYRESLGAAEGLAKLEPTRAYLPVFLFRIKHGLARALYHSGDRAEAIAMLDALLVEGEGLQKSGFDVQGDLEVMHMDKELYLGAGSP